MMQTRSLLPTINKATRQAGMTLIEIMIALLLGLFLIAGILQIFVSNKHSYRLTENQSRLQENARFALEMLNHDIRLAGFIGCSGIRADNPTVIANNPLVAPLAHPGIPAVVAASVITGGNNSAAGSFSSPDPALSTTPLTNAIIGTDAITVQFAESCGGFTTAATTSVNPTGVIAAGNTCGITLGTGTSFATLGTPLVISDCSTAHIFRASAGTGQNKDSTGTATGSLGPTATPKSYPSGSEILLFRSYTYYVRLGTSGQPSLWRLNNNFPITANSNPEEMIEGVENMQITYGLDSDATPDGSANRYIENPTAAQWPNIVSVRIVLTVRSLEDNLLEAQNPARTYNSAAANNLRDRRLVKSFTATIDLRNR